MGKSAVVLALVATNPASPTNLATSQQIRDRTNLFHANATTRQQIESAYTARMSSLCLSHNMKEIDSSEYHQMKMALNQKKKNQLAEMRPLPTKRLKLKTTVILTSVSLLGQW